ncbi:uncharacterized protein [Sinocyclocheilus grahami]|uniref:uncharacterized protein n=1 Tax=Sinocyclocheilus grahami TaxID=75366 RepID=UPI0007ACD930|nr:PREDICTED: uncharacterized protein LOC107568975 [Sinocyclocheilus grahami]
MDLSVPEEMDVEVQKMTEKRLIDDTHSYTCRSKKGGECDSFPNTPSKTQPPKKLAKGDASEDLTLSQVQHSIIQIIKQSSEEIKDMVKENSTSINLLKEALEVVHSEIFDIRKENENLKNKNEEIVKRVSDLEDKLNDQDRYCRRWNLRLEGLTERTEDDVKSRVTEICKAVVVEEERNFVANNVDIAHRVGRPIDRAKGKKPRPVMIRFASRTARDLTWKGAKGNDFLKKNNMYFKEDLTIKDRATRNLLWPVIDKARKEGKRAFYVGVKAIVDGKEIKH